MIIYLTVKTYKDKRSLGEHTIFICLFFYSKTFKKYLNYSKLLTS